MRKGMGRDDGQITKMGKEKCLNIQSLSLLGLGVDGESLSLSQSTTLNNGYLGSRDDEERSELR